MGPKIPGEMSDTERLAKVARISSLFDDDVGFTQTVVKAAYLLSVKEQYVFEAKLRKDLPFLKDTGTSHPLRLSNNMAKPVLNCLLYSTLGIVTYHDSMNAIFKNAIRAGEGIISEKIREGVKYRSCKRVQDYFRLLSEYKVHPLSAAYVLSASLCELERRVWNIQKVVDVEHRCKNGMRCPLRVYLSADLFTVININKFIADVDAVEETKN